MYSKRRSGRIAKELPIVLLGTDTSGKVFAEETKTVVLSRHGAGVRSKYRLAPDEVLTLRLAGMAKEAEVRLVGKIGEESGRYIYGLAFVDSSLEFWQMDFPPPEQFEPTHREITLECTFCRARQTVQQDEIEEDVYTVNENVLRFCNTCGISTPWKTPGEGARGEEPPSPALLSALAFAGKPALRPIAPFTHSSPQVGGRVKTIFTAAAPESPTGAYSGAALETVSTAVEQVVRADFAETYDAPSEDPGKLSVAEPKPSSRPLDPQGRPVNRRKQMRVRVKFSACVRHPELGDEIVECENVSKGGLCFLTKSQYAPGTTIEVAAPFAPGDAALFLPARITRVEPVAGEQFFRYGAAYLEPNSSESVRAS
jgi:hypothetical protein